MTEHHDLNVADLTPEPMTSAFHKDMLSGSRSSSENEAGEEWSAVSQGRRGYKGKKGKGENQSL